jgi:hypothetical protein
VPAPARWRSSGHGPARPAVAAVCEYEPVGNRRRSPGRYWVDGRAPRGVRGMKGAQGRAAGHAQRPLGIFPWAINGARPRNGAAVRGRRQIGGTVVAWRAGRERRGCPGGEFAQPVESARPGLARWLRCRAAGAKPNALRSDRGPTDENSSMGRPARAAAQPVASAPGAPQGRALERSAEVAAAWSPGRAGTAHVESKAGDYCADVRGLTQQFWLAIQQRRKIVEEEYVAAVCSLCDQSA